MKPSNVGKASPTRHLDENREWDQVAQRLQVRILPRGSGIDKARTRVLEYAKGIHARVPSLQLQTQEAEGQVRKLCPGVSRHQSGAKQRQSYPNKSRCAEGSKITWLAINYLIDTVREVHPSLPTG